jgi:hypothetical protein
MEWQWVKVNGMTYLHDPNTCSLYDNTNLFPSGYLYSDGTTNFTLKPASLVKSMRDSDLQRYMKSSKVSRESKAWASHWHARSVLGVKSVKNLTKCMSSIKI